MKLCALMIFGLGLICVEPQKDKTAIDTSCQAFEPIRWSRQDTEETIRRAKEHNAAWEQLCAER